MFTQSIAFSCCVFLFFQSFISCSQHTNPQVAFYRWKVESSYQSGLKEEDVLKNFQSKTLYIKIMDVDWDEVYGVYPTTTFAEQDLYNGLNKKLLDTTVITPVVFITVRALEKTGDSDVTSLAQKIVLKTDQLMKGRRLYTDDGPKIVMDSMVSYGELQLDCDWTAATQKKYFKLLAEIKKLVPQKLITATLRLHQYKYPKRTGIPPADELYLMCYNTGTVKKLTEPNSIFDYETAKKYFTDAGIYPKKLNFALPAFSWVVVFKNNQFYKIDNNIDEGMFSDKTVTAKIGANTYMLLTDTVINNNFLRKGDILKWEKITPDAMQQAAQLCSKAINSDSFKVVFYDIDHIKPGDYEALHKAYNYFIF